MYKAIVAMVSQRGHCEQHFRSQMRSFPVEPNDIRASSIASTRTTAAATYHSIAAHRLQCHNLALVAIVDKLTTTTTTTRS